MAVTPHVRSRVSIIVKRWDESNASVPLVEAIDGPAFKVVLIWIVTHVWRTYERPNHRLNIFLDSVEEVAFSTNLPLPHVIASVIRSFVDTETNPLSDCFMCQIGADDWKVSQGKVPLISLARALMILSLLPREKEGITAPKWVEDALDPVGISAFKVREKRPTSSELKRVLMGDLKGDDNSSASEDK